MNNPVPRKSRYENQLKTHFVMKKTLLTLCCALCLATCAMAQNGKNADGYQRQAHGSETVLFSWAGHEETPASQGDWRDKYNNIEKKLSQGARMHSLAEHPALQQAFVAKKTSQKNKTTKDDTGQMTVLGGFGPVSWTVLTNPENGESQLITIEYDPSDVNRNGVQSYSKGITLTCYDDNLQPTKEFYLKTSDTTQVVIVMMQYSANHFNSDSKLEFMLHAHSFAAGYGPQACRDTLFIVNEDGEILQKMGGVNNISLHSVPGEYSEEPRVAVTSAYYTELHDTAFTYIYKARDFVRENPNPLFRFAVPDALISYLSAPMASFMEIEGEPYYVTCQYSKPYIANGDPLNPVVEKDNDFRVIMFDINFDTVKDIHLPLLGQDEIDYSMASLDYFDEYRITRHTFNGDDKFEIIYCADQYFVDCDCIRTALTLVNEDGEVIKHIATGVSAARRLVDIPGQSDEYAITGSMGYQMLRMPEMEDAAIIPPVLEGDALSSNFNRVPNGNGGYDYIFEIGMGEADDETTYGIIARYDQAGNMTQRIHIDIGRNGATFSPLFNAQTLNPYTFIPDEETEYLYMSSTLEDDGMHRRIGVATAEKNLYVIDDHPVYGSIASAGLLRDMAGTKTSALFVSFTSDAISIDTTIFYKLPFEVPDTLQGQGTEEDPYIVTNAMELDQVRNYPDANFVLANDIDMSSYLGVDGLGFISIPDFSGHFDGRNHCISNIHLRSHGLFSLLLPGAIIENLRLENISFSDENEGNIYVGCIASSALGDTIRNCHVYTDYTSFDDESFGGIVGEASVSIVIDQCSFEGGINMPNGRNVGGLVGELKGRPVMNSTSKGSIRGMSAVGGICGSTNLFGNILNCYSSMEVTGAKAVGGIVGENAGQITNTYADGNILFARNPQVAAPGEAAGIAGNTSGGQIKHSFALNDTVWSPENYARVAYGTSGLDSNFAYEGMEIGASLAELAPVDDADCQMDRMHGESHPMEDFGQEFFAGCGWLFGANASEPWQMTDGNPRLWWEFNVLGIRFPFGETTLDKGESLTLVPTIIPADATNKNVFFTTSDAAVASVNQEGVITANNTGTATITATTVEGGMTASCIVHVEIPVEKVLFTADTFYVAKMESVLLTAEVLPDDATDKSLRYYSLNSYIARNAGSQVTGMNPGYTQVVATAVHGDAADTCVIFVYIPIEQIFLNESSITLSNATPSFQLRPTLYPEDATEIPLSWSSDDESVATVNASGLVMGHAQGSTTVRVSTPDGSVSASCYVNVTENVANEGGDAAFLAGRIDRGDFVIESNLQITAVQMYTVTGNLVYENRTFKASSVRIPGGGFSNGLYLIRATLEDGQQVPVRIVK